MSDQYFKNKAEGILKSINFDIITKDEYAEAIQKIYIALKEVARDQRYACVDAYNRHTEIDGKMGISTTGIIQNANIEGE